MDVNLRLPKNTISSYQVSMILIGARSRGLDVACLLEASGIMSDLIAQPRARVTQAQYKRLVVLLSRVMRDEFLGLCSQPLSLGTFSSCCRLIVTGTNLGDALRIGFRYLHPNLSDFTPRLRIRDGMAYCELQERKPLSEGARYARRVFLFFSYGLACWLVEKKIPLSRVFYASDESHVPTEAIQLFQAPVEYRQEGMGYCFPAEWLKTPVLQTSETVESYVRRAPSSMLVLYRDQKSLTDRVRRLIRRDLTASLLTFEDIADQLKTTPQTLRRKLRIEGRSFQEIKNELRRDIAIELLADPKVKVNDIANRLGFSELATFHRAFREWTGTTPAKYRSLG